MVTSNPNVSCTSPTSYLLSLMMLHPDLTLVVLSTYESLCPNFCMTAFSLFGSQLKWNL